MIMKIKEFVYHISEEEKIPLFINKVIFTKNEQFVVFSKDKKNIMNLFDICKKYSISYSHLLSENQSLAFKNYNENKSKIFFITDENINKKTFFIPKTNYIIHLDIPTHPLIYQRRNELIKNKNLLHSIYLFCTEKEYQDFKAIEIYFDKKISIGKIKPNEVILPSIHQIKSYTHTKRSKKSKVISTSKKQIIEEKAISINQKISFWEKVKKWFFTLFKKSKENI